MSNSGGMIAVQSFGGEALDHAAKVLAGIPDGISRAVKSALPRAASSLRGESVRAIQTKYDISAANIRSKQNISIKYSYGNVSMAYIRFSGKKIPLFRYNGTSPKKPAVNESKTVGVKINGTYKTVHPGAAASAHQLNGTSPTKFENAFVAEMESGHIGIFERTGGVTANGKDQIKELQGSSVPQMLGSESVQKHLADRASQKFEERMEHEILRILNGWGSK